MNHVRIFDQVAVPGLSHHELIILTYTINICKKNVDVKHYRNFSRINMHCLLADLVSKPWHTIWQTPDVNVQVEIFNKAVRELFDTHGPLVPFLERKTVVVMSNVLNMANIDRDLAHKRWRRTCRKEDWIEFTNLRARAVSIENAEWQKHYSTQFSPKLDSSELWKNIGKLGIKDDPGPITTHSSSDHFLNVVDQSSNQNNTSKTVRTDSMFVTLVPGQFTFSNVSQEAVHKAIISIRSNAIGDDEISPKFLKIILPHILMYITYIFNSIFTYSIFPCAWKKARVIPIPKINDPKLPSDYRPISILPFLSKAFERLLHMQLTGHLGSNNYLVREQSGFRKHRSTETTLVNLTEDIRVGLDKGQLSLLVLLDFSKAFDNVDHHKLIEKLNTYGTDKSVCTLLWSYLRERSQFCYTIDRQFIIRLS